MPDVATSSFGTRYPPWRFGMAENPYLFGRLSGGSGGARYDAVNPFGPGYTALMAPPHMVREGYSRPRPELASPTPSGRIAPDVAGGRWFNASRDGGARLHNGIDFEATPGTPVVSTVDGVVTMVGRPYPGAKNAGEPTYHYVDVTTADGHVTRLHYVDPSVKLGDRVRAGETQIGVAQDITLRYPDNPYHVHSRCGTRASRCRPWTRSWRERTSNPRSTITICPRGSIRPTSSRGRGRSRSGARLGREWNETPDDTDRVAALDLPDLGGPDSFVACFPAAGAAEIRTIASTGEASSACIGDPRTPLCALDTWEAYFVWRQPSLCKLVGLEGKEFRGAEAKARARAGCTPTNPMTCWRSKAAILLTSRTDS